MPSKPMRPCLHPGCRKLCRGGYCPEHQPPKPTRQHSVMPWHSWYALPIWRETLRPQQLLREPFCRECAAIGLRVRATDVDHVVPHRGNWELFVHGELQSLCHQCHSRKTMRERNAVKPKRN